MATNTGVSCLPRNPSLLWFQTPENGHRSYPLFTDNVSNPLKARRAVGDLFEHIKQLDGEVIPNEIFKYIRSAGFGGIFKANNNKYDHQLICALVERWRPETHTFHFPCGEATVTLQDVQVIWGLPVDGPVVTGFYSQKTQDQWETECDLYLGFRGETISHGRIKISELLQQVYIYPSNFDRLSREAKEEIYRQKARTYILAMFAGVMFVDSCHNDVSLNFLKNLDNLSVEGRLSWGSAVLACLYSNLCKGAKAITKGIQGPLLLLQYWAWERISNIAPTRIPDVDHPWNYEHCLAAKWDTKKSHTETPAHVKAAYRQVFSGLSERQCITNGKNYDGALDPYIGNGYMYAVRLWNIKENRELVVENSRPSYWKAQCITNGKNYDGALDPYPCQWIATGSCRNKKKMWMIKKWVNHHNCYSHVVSNNNRCLTSSMIASEIAPLIKEKIDYSVKLIQAYVKQCLNVDINYDKGWNGRRIAIERMYGTWQSNFASLPTYIDELKRSNPDTVVEWCHGLESGSNKFTFKYVFWAFEPAIYAFVRCIPVICVDGTHLKGSYKGKLLTAVTKNANSQILPVAYALVDEETNESWSWFFQQFETHVASRYNRSELCVISDRHKGIIHAMESMPNWHHRFCLRHICSNVNSKFKRRELKPFCWTAGSTTRADKYVWAVDKIKGVDPEAWDYLVEIGLDKVTLMKDKKYRRWGNTTTNIAECLNNVLGMARMLPIRALIDHTFHYTRSHVVNQYVTATGWQKPLADTMWNSYEKRQKISTRHKVEVYDINEGLYVVRTKEKNPGREELYTVTFAKNKCSCGRWQHQRFPCSHSIIVARKNKVEAITLPSKRYTTRSWRNQYNIAFNPLREVHNWREADWMIQGDSSKLVTHRGRRRTTRYHNEMDEGSNRGTTEDRLPPRCGKCNGLGHNRNTCNVDND